MGTTRYFVDTRWGGSEDDPGVDRLREIIDELATPDEEHPDTWLTHCPSEWTLRLDEDRFAYLEDEDGEITGHLAGVTAEQALRLWILFADGGRDAVASDSWIPGAPVIPDEVLRARQERADQLTLEGDRRFYDLLGPERTDVPCRSNGCGRGAIKGSVLCRIHHFEQIYRKPCPFKD